MRTRRDIFGLIVAAGLVTAVGSTMVVSSGCGGADTPQNTMWFGTYGGYWITNVPFSDLADGGYLSKSGVYYDSCSGSNTFSGNLVLSIDVKGHITGYVQNPFPNANPNGESAQLSGTVNNSGKFKFNFSWDGTNYSATGSLSDQQVSVSNSEFATGVPAGGTACEEVKFAAAQHSIAPRQIGGTGTATPTPTPSPTPTASTGGTGTTTGSGNLQAGIAGTFTMNVNGATYTGFFAGSGGDQIT